MSSVQIISHVRHEDVLLVCGRHLALARKPEVAFVPPAHQVVFQLPLTIQPNLAYFAILGGIDVEIYTKVIVGDRRPLLLPLVLQRLLIPILGIDFDNFTKVVVADRRPLLLLLMLRRLLILVLRRLIILSLRRWFVRKWLIERLDVVGAL